MSLSTPYKLADVLEVVYLCGKGHHSPRFWRVPCKVHREIRCDICKQDAWISVTEHRRHAKLHTELEQWLDDPTHRLVQHRP